MRRTSRLLLPLALLGLAACAAHPLGYMSGGNGRVSGATESLAWGFTAISCAVMLIIAGLILVGILRARRAAKVEGETVRSGGGLGFIYWGVGLSFPVLVAMAVWSFAVTRTMAQPPGEPAVNVDVTGNRWWWDIEYRDLDGARAFRTANELTIPVGVPVALHLMSADVIHDFWVPKLGPKMDMIPGKTNTAWLQADKPGVYYGQCAEYCGLEHAKMGFRVVALPPADYAAWRARAERPASVVAEAGSAQLFSARCSACHSIRGGEAGGIAGPDLTHFASRSTIAAGVLPNTPEGRDLWLADTQGVKPGALMPQIDLTRSERAQLVSYLGSLN